MIIPWSSSTQPAGGQMTLFYAYLKSKKSDKALEII